MVVHRLQVRLVGEVGWNGHLVQAGVEVLALVHDRERLALDRLQQFGGVGERCHDAIGAEDRQSVPGEQDLGSQRGHLAQRRSPVGQVALDLLGVAGVGECPDEQVAGMEHLAFWHPRPRRVIGLTASVVQLEGEVAAVEREVRRVGDVGVAVLARPCELRDVDGELAAVDRRVPSAGLLVPAEVGGQFLVGVDDGSLPALVGCFSVEQCRAEHVVDVMVRIDGRTHGCVGTPAANGVVDGAPIERASGVEHHQAVAGVEGVDGCNRLEREQALVDLLARGADGAVVVVDVYRLHRMVGVDEFPASLPVLLGEFPDRCHLQNLVACQATSRG